MFVYEESNPKHLFWMSSYIPKRVIFTKLFISTCKHVTTTYNYEWDMTHLSVQPCMGKDPPLHTIMHAKIFFILLLYSYSTNILQLSIIKYNKSYAFLILVHVLLF